jgi:hypothetical protein
MKFLVTVEQSLTRLGEVVVEAEDENSLQRAFYDTPQKTLVTAISWNDHTLEADSTLNMSLKEAVELFSSTKSTLKVSGGRLKKVKP